MRTAARPRLADGFTDHFEAGGQIRSIHGLTGDPVPGSLVQERAAGELPLGGSGIGVVIVGNDQHERQFFHGGLVHRLMKRAGGSSAVANAGRADCSGNAFETMGQQRAVHDGDHGAQVTDHHEQPFPGPAAVDVAVTGAHRAQRRAQISPHGIQNWLSESEPSRPVPNERREDVSLAQGQAHRDAQSFLPASQKHAAMDFAHAIEAREFVVQDAREQHHTVRLRVRIAN